MSKIPLLEKVAISIQCPDYQLIFCVGWVDSPEAKSSKKKIWRYEALRQNFFLKTLTKLKILQRSFVKIFIKFLSIIFERSLEENKLWRICRKIFKRSHLGKIFIIHYAFDFESQICVPNSNVTLDYKINIINLTVNIYQFDG